MTVILLNYFKSIGKKLSIYKVILIDNIFHHMIELNKSVFVEVLYV